MQEHASGLVSDFAVKTPSLDTPLEDPLGRQHPEARSSPASSRARPPMLVAAQPTRGVDIGATWYIHQCLLKQREAGTAILLISEDLDEIRALSDRIAVMYEGRIVGIVERDAATVEEIGLMMSGAA